jgi:hypothetical protein
MLDTQYNDCSLYHSVQMRTSSTFCPLNNSPPPITTILSLSLSTRFSTTKSYSIWDITPRSPLKDNRRFWGICNVRVEKSDDLERTTKRYIPQYRTIRTFSCYTIYCAAFCTLRLFVKIRKYKWYVFDMYRSWLSSRGVHNKFRYFKRLNMLIKAQQYYKWSQYTHSNTILYYSVTGCEGL